MPENMIVTIVTAVISAVSTYFVTSLKSKNDKDMKMIDTEPDRVDAYMKINSGLLERYEKQFDELREELVLLRQENKAFSDNVIALTLENKELKKEVIKLTDENRKTNKVNTILVEQVADLNTKLNNLKTK